MSNPGLGALIHMLGGGSRNSVDQFYGRKIVSAELKKGDDSASQWDARGKDALLLTFEDGQRIAISDDDQSCCESRYMTTDDDLAKIVGGKLARIDVKEGEGKKDDDYGEHEIAFLEIGTDECFVTVATHNEHNGYYGGFGLTIDLVTA